MTQVTFDTTPLPVHIPFHRSTAYERALFGAFGSGKTYALVDEVHAWCLEQPGIRGLVARKTVPELRDTTEPIFLERMPSDLLKAGEIKRSGGHLERFIYPNGSEVLFRSMDDWNKHRSLNVGFIAYDEANEIDEETYQGMSSRVRQRDLTQKAKDLGYTHEITRRGIWLATNPSGHDWLYHRFVDPSTRLQGTEFYKSTSLDNPFLPMGYLESLLAYPEPWVQRYVLCQFDDFAGQIYGEWSFDRHVIEPIATYPKGSMFWMGFDPGTSNRNPSAGLWVWVDKENRRLVGIAEYQEPDRAATEHAREWRLIEARQNMNVDWRVGDPNAINNRDRGSNMALSDIYRRLGFNFQLGVSREKDRIPTLGELIHTGRFVVTRECPQTFDQIKNYRWEDLTPAQRAKGADPNERALKKNTHLVECAQYLAGRWVSPLSAHSRPLETPADQFRREIHAAIRKSVGAPHQHR
mgnify:FL=1